ncbi:MAG: hypothetical protein ACI9F2_000106 [Lysobacterales bacterium]|jgi:hypothetical protein
MNVIRFGVILVSIVCATNAYALEYKIDKSKHFVVEYPVSVGKTWASTVLRTAERNYDKIANRLGFRRYTNYWTWDNRAKIIIHPDKNTFIEKTGQPFWSEGGARYGHQFSQGRSIISYKQETEFIDSILPHEVSHLILRDFIGYNRKIPIWFDEGIAQLFEVDKLTKANKAIHVWLKKNKPIPFHQLFRYEVRFETNPLKVDIFYIQSVTIIDFLLKNYGSTKFGELCRDMRDGYYFQEALLRTYKIYFKTVDEFEKKWVSYMKTY